MISFYLKNAILSYIVFNAVLFITKDNWNKLSPKHNGFIKRHIFRLCVCLIPLFRWVMVFFVLIIGIALGNEEFLEECKKREDK